MLYEYRTPLSALQAVVAAETSPEAHTKDISKCTKRIAFFGTPHHGSDKAQWIDSCRGFFSLIKDTNSGLLKDLEKNSEVLVRLGEDFGKWLRKHEKEVGIACFYEELKSAVGFIVPRESAKLLEYPNESIWADHCGMCKYANKDDPMYRKVSGRLVRCAKEIREAPKKQEDKAEEVYLQLISARGLRTDKFSRNPNSWQIPTSLVIITQDSNLGRSMTPLVGHL